MQNPCRRSRWMAESCISSVFLNIEIEERLPGPEWRRGLRLRSEGLLARTHDDVRVRRLCRATPAHARRHTRSIWPAEPVWNMALISDLRTHVASMAGRFRHDTRRGLRVRQSLTVSSSVTTA